MKNTRSIPLDGLALRGARIAATLTQVELAARAGTTGTTVYRLETSRQKCSLGLLRRLSAALAVSPVDLLDSSVRDEYSI